MFVDETIFFPVKDVRRWFDAVYNANFSAFKRRELAAEIPTCLHLGYFSDVSMRKNAVTLYEQIKAGLPHHRFANPVRNQNVARLPSAHVNELLAQCEVGLCLSAEEGPMIACMEYLMAGLPVVSTRNVGGRDRYLDPEISITVEPNPREVRQAVDALIARAIPRDVVRPGPWKGSIVTVLPSTVSSRDCEPGIRRYQAAAAGSRSIM